MEMVILGSTMLAPIFFIAARKYILSFFSFVGVGYMFYLIYQLGAPIRMESMEIKNFLYIANVLNILALANVAIYVAKKRKEKVRVDRYQASNDFEIETKKVNIEEMKTIVVTNPELNDDTDARVKDIIRKLKQS